MTNANSLNTNDKYTQSDKKQPEQLREQKIINQALDEVSGFREMIYKVERSLSVLGRGQSYH